MAGTISQLWRYPVKSMQGETLQAAELDASGLPGDRGWALRDEQRGGIEGAKKLGDLMRCAARYPDEPKTLDVPAEVELPGGERFRTDAADANEKLTRFLGRPVSVWPRRPADDVAHYRRGRPDSSDRMAELRTTFALEEGEPLPDFSSFPRDMLALSAEFATPPGTYFDAFPLNLLTRRSLESLQALLPESRIDVRRFRPNVVVETPENGSEFPELAWVGKRLQLGGARIRVIAPTPRCVMITREVAGLPKDSRIMRGLVKNAGQNFGVYATIEAPGPVRVGDALEVLGT